MINHPNRITLDRFSVGDLDADAARQVEDHVRDCEACSRYNDDLRAAREVRLAAVPPTQFLEQLGARQPGAVGGRVIPLERGVKLRRRAARFGAGLVAVLAAAAAVLLLVRRPFGVSQDMPSEGVSLKGGGVSVYRSRSGQVRAMGAEDRIRAGDALRIVVTQSRASLVAAWFIDANGEVDRLLPEAAVALPAGESPLPGSAVVDNPCVDLRLVVILGITGVDEVERRLKEGSPRAEMRHGDAAPAGEGWVPDGAVVRHFRCE